jgi:DNA-binding MarR family transcriptional regulator
VTITPAEFQVLVSLADGEKHGDAIGKEVASRTNGQVAFVRRRSTPSSSDCWSMASSTKAPRDPDPALDERRRNYRVTPRGRKAAEEEALRMEMTARQARTRLRKA